MLTRQQQTLLIYIKSCLDETGIPPSFDEMARTLNLRSKSGIHRLLLALEERGFICRLPNRARAIEILRMPGEADPRKYHVPHAVRWLKVHQEDREGFRALGWVDLIRHGRPPSSYIGVMAWVSNLAPALPAPDEVRRLSNSASTSA